MSEQREISFHVWDGKRLWRDAVCYERGGIAEDVDYINAGSPDGEWLQYVTTANGQRIYEGDVIRWHTEYEIDNDDRSGTDEVAWHDEACGFYPFYLNARWRCDVIVDEVIGNKYEVREARQ